MDDISIVPPSTEKNHPFSMYMYAIPIGFAAVLTIMCAWSSRKCKRSTRVAPAQETDGLEVPPADELAQEKEKKGEAEEEEEFEEEEEEDREEEEEEENDMSNSRINVNIHLS